MHQTSATIRCLAACLTGLLLAAALGCASRNNPWVAPDQGQLLTDKVKVKQNAYLRYAEAEEEARRDGDAVAMERYREAKEAARTEYDRCNQELAQYKAAHPMKTAP